MISKIEGQLVLIHNGRAQVALSMGLTFEVLLPAFAAYRLMDREGQAVALHTLTFFESTAQGATMFPRMAGFLAPADRAFFELFVTVKGIGHRKALRALALPPAQIAAAIADQDIKLLQTLPEVGRRTAETIVVTLKDKVDAFVSAGAYPADASGDDAGLTGGSTTGDVSGSGGSSGGGVAREALEVLLQLGEARLDAVQWIDRVLSSADRPSDAQGVVSAVYRMKAGG